MAIRAGELYLYRDRWKEAHPWIVASDPAKHDDLVVVSATTDKSWKDRICKLSPLDHRKIKHGSVIYYQGAMLTTRSMLEKRIAAGELEAFGPISASALKRVRDGFSCSEHARPIHEQKLRDQGVL